VAPFNLSAIDLFFFIFNIHNLIIIFIPKRAPSLSSTRALVTYPFWFEGSDLASLIFYLEDRYERIGKKTTPLTEAAFVLKC